MEMKPLIFFFIGKMGAGKSTFASILSEQLKTVYISEDEWLADLYQEEIKSFKDYITYSNRMKPIMKKHVQRILATGTSVVMDFPGNTVKQRQWFKEIIDGIDCDHKLIYIDATDELCLKHLEKRREEQPERANFDSEEVFKEVTKYFEEPTEDEGFDLEVIAQDS